MWGPQGDEVDAWDALLWCAGRIALPGNPQLDGNWWRSAALLPADDPQRRDGPRARCVRSGPPTRTLKACRRGTTPATSLHVSPLHAPASRRADDAGCLNLPRVPCLPEASSLCDAAYNQQGVDIICRNRPDPAYENACSAIAESAVFPCRVQVQVIRDSDSYVA